MSKVVTVIMFLTLCSCGPSLHTQSFTEYLTESSNKFRILKKDSAVTDIDHFKGLKWDHFYVLTSYTSPESLMGDLAAHKDLVTSTGIYGGHKGQLIAFFYKNVYTGYDDVRNFSFSATGLMDMAIPHRFNKGKAKFMCIYRHGNFYSMIPVQRPIHVYPSPKDWLEPLKSGVYDTSKLVK